MDIKQLPGQIIDYFEKMPQYKLISYGCIALGILLVLLAIILW